MEPQKNRVLQGTTEQEHHENGIKPSGAIEGSH